MGHTFFFVLVLILDSGADSFANPCPDSDSGFEFGPQPDSYSGLDSHPGLASHCKSNLEA